MSFTTIVNIADTTTLETTNLPLFPDIFYTYTTVLEDKTFVLSFLWLSRLNEWTWSMYDEDNNPLMVGRVLTYNYLIDPPLESGLTGVFILLPNMETVGKYEDLKYNLSEYYSFQYVYEPVIV